LNEGDVKMLRGISGSSGYGIGKVFLYHAFDPVTKEQKVSPEELETEHSRLAAAIAQARGELSALQHSLGEDKAAIFAAHLEMLEDEALQEDIRYAIESGHDSAEWAVFSTYQTYIDMMLGQSNELLRERAADLKDVRNRILRILRGEAERSLTALQEPVIVAARDILPSDVAQIDNSRVLAFLTETGGVTSHAAILARSYGIPAVLGIPELMERLGDGQSVIVDGEAGQVLTDPDEQTLAEYRTRKAEYLETQALNLRYLPLKAETRDGVSIQTSMNIGSAELPQTAVYADGVGLFRSEFLYMEREALPSEEAQFAAYASVLRKMGDRPVILRTLDIGGDKTLPYLPLPKEDNPFLGNRAIRLCFTQETVFRTQLRAAYRAAATGGNLWIMFPMIGSVEDFRKARGIARSVREGLKNGGLDVPNVPLGVMVEIPSLAICADHIAREADFGSIGTNDLCQYTFAADRMSPAVAAYARPLSAAMLRLIRGTAEAFAAEDKPLSVCGELAGQAAAIPLLVGCGVRKLSMSASVLAQGKRVIRSCSFAECENLAKKAENLATEQEVASLAEAFLRGCQARS
jgi:phosphotransferase system enzyme I (PtsI)